jgi:hypothetical protein
MNENHINHYVLDEAAIKEYGPYGKRLKEIIANKQTWWNPDEINDVA